MSLVTEEDVESIPMENAAPAKKILICDDDETFVEILEKLLADNGYRVVTAGTAFDCLERFMDESPDLMLLDIDIPDGDGFSVLEALGRQGQLGSCEVLVVSGYQNEADRDRARALGARDFVVKPINCRQLVETVKGLLAPEGGGDGPP